MQFYKPYILSKAQEDTVARQIAEAEERIAAEVAEYEGACRDGAAGGGGGPGGVEGSEMGGEGAGESAGGDADVAALPRTTETAPNEAGAQKEPQPEPQRHSSETLVDENEVVVEGDEDTVIY